MKASIEKPGNRCQLGSLTEYERSRNLLANPPNSFNVLPFATFAATTRSSVRVSRATVSHSRSRSSPPKMEGHQFHPYHLHSAQPSSLAIRNSSSSISQVGGQITELNIQGPLEPPPLEDNVARVIDFVALGAPSSAVSPSSDPLSQQQSVVQSMELDFCTRAAKTTTGFCPTVQRSTAEAQVPIAVSLACGQQQAITNSLATADAFGNSSQREATAGCKRALLCGLAAVNSLLLLNAKSTLRREDIDTINGAVSEAEAAIREDRKAVDTCLQPDGNYALDVISAALHIYGNLRLFKGVFDVSGVPECGSYLVGDGVHWQVAHHTGGANWLCFDNGSSSSISDIAAFSMRFRQQGVFLRVCPRPLEQASMAQNHRPPALTVPVLVDQSMQPSPAAPAVDATSSSNTNSVADSSRQQLPHAPPLKPTLPTEPTRLNYSTDLHSYRCPFEIYNAHRGWQGFESLLNHLESKHL